LEARKIAIFFHYTIFPLENIEYFFILGFGSKKLTNIFLFSYFSAGKHRIFFHYTIFPAGKLQNKNKR